MSTLSENVDNRLKQYGYLIYIANQQLNIISRRNQRKTINKLIEEAVLPLTWNICSLESPLLDIGTGAGIPGIPIKLAIPQARMTLLDSNRRKCVFLTSAISELQLSDIEVNNERAEEYVNNSNNHQIFMTVVSRGVGKINLMLRWAEILLMPGGELILWKGDSIRDEMAEYNHNLWEEPQFLACGSDLVLGRIVRKHSAEIIIP